MQAQNVNGDVIDMMLSQLGAKEIHNFSSTMHIANFDLGDGFEVSYVFNITHGEKYFLQRMKPYAMVHGKYASYKEIIDFITEDIAKFRRAKQINDPKVYLKLAKDIERVKLRAEHIFLNHDVATEDFEEILDGFNGLMERIETANAKSSKIQS